MFKKVCRDCFFMEDNKRTTFRMLTSLVDRLDIVDIVIDRGNGRVPVRYIEDLKALHSGLGKPSEIRRADMSRTGIKNAFVALDLHVMAFEYKDWYIFSDETSHKPGYRKP